MPWESAAQQRWGHTPAGERALGGPAKVHEWDQATNFKRLPERAGGSMAARKAIRGIAAARVRAQVNQSISRSKRGRPVGAQPPVTRAHQPAAGRPAAAHLPPPSPARGAAPRSNGVARGAGGRMGSPMGGNPGGYDSDNDGM